MKIPYRVSPLLLTLGMFFMFTGIVTKLSSDAPPVRVIERIDYYPHEGHCFIPSQRRSGYFDEIDCSKVKP